MMQTKKEVANLWNWATNRWETAGLNKAGAIVSDDGSELTIVNNSGASTARINILKNTNTLAKNKSYRFYIGGQNIATARRKNFLQIFDIDDNLIVSLDFYGEIDYILPAQEKDITLVSTLYQENYAIGATSTFKLEITEV